MRPTPWLNPFEYAAFEKGDFESYARARRDREWWLGALHGCTLVCTCKDESSCHGHVLIDLFNEVHGDAEPHEPELWLDLTDDSEAAASDEVALSSSTNDSYVLEVWSVVVQPILQSDTKVVWEIMAGQAVVSHVFEAAGWLVATPVDANINSAMNILDPRVVAFMLTVIQSGAIALLWLAPPCSTNSMARNGDPSTQCGDSRLGRFWKASQTDGWSSVNWGTLSRT